MLGFGQKTLFVIIPLGITGLLLNIPVMSNAICPKCGESLIGPLYDFLRLLPIFKLILGSNEMCSKCKEKFRTRGLW